MLNNDEIRNLASGYSKMILSSAEFNLGASFFITIGILGNLADAAANSEDNPTAAKAAALEVFDNALKAIYKIREVIQALPEVSDVKTPEELAEELLSNDKVPEYLKEAIRKSQNEEENSD